MAVFTMAMSALLALATTTEAVALLVVRLGTMLPALAVAVSAIVVPDGVPAFTCNTSVNPTGEPTAKVLPSVQVIVPAAPTAGVVQIQPPGGVMDWKFVLGGVVWISVTGAVAATGPSLVTLWV